LKRIGIDLSLAVVLNVDLGELKFLVHYHIFTFAHSVVVEDLHYRATVVVVTDLCTRLIYTSE
jgi:hypothetical protein